MYRRFVSSAALAAALFVVPLLVHPARLAWPAPWLGFAAALAILLSQPPMRYSDPADRSSARGIMASMLAAQLVAVLDYGTHARADASWLAAGALVALAGFALRLWAIRALGRFFTAEVRVVGDQTVVRDGPYAWLRHPSYTGALLVAAGQAVALQSATGVLLVAVLCVPAYLYRIRVEEAALVDRLGAAYVDYRRTIPALLPGLR
jgi:protein-S-isoprenylcysteine O-methyltransferase